MLTSEQKELFQKDKYELVDIIIQLRTELKNKKPTMSGDMIIQKALNKLNKETNYGHEESKTYKKESEC